MKHSAIAFAIVLVFEAKAVAQIEWIHHTIDNSFYGAWNAYAADLDRDEDIDVLGASLLGNEITWWENDGINNFIEHTLDSNFDGSISVQAVNIDADGDIDVLGAAYYGNEISWWENDGNQNFTKHIISNSFYWVHDIIAADLDNDTDIDIVGITDEGGYIAWWENTGGGNFTFHSIASEFYGGRSIDAADLDHDGDMDVIGASDVIDKLSWWENDGNQNFLERNIASGYDAFWVYLTDLNGDGDIDILGCAAGQNDISWWENDGAENFTRHIIDGNIPGPQAVHANDLDNDGDIDVVGAARYTNELSWWENDGNMGFIKHIIQQPYGYASNAWSADVDSDGDIDVLGTAFFDNDVSWWENLGSSIISATLGIPDLFAENGQNISLPITTTGLAEQTIGGVEFHIGYNEACLAYTSFTSDFLVNPLINVAEGVINILWEDYQNPILVPDSAAIGEIQFTVSGQIGDTCRLQWTGNNELADSLGEIIPGVSWTDGSVMVIEFHSITGRVVYYDLLTPVPGVTMTLSGDYSEMDTSDGAGAYGFWDLFPGSFTICPSRLDDDPGVTVTDIVNIRRHIVRIESFDTPYKSIAADVNKSRNVSVADVIKLRRYLADLEDLPSGNWAFVDSSFAITENNWSDAPVCLGFNLWDSDLTDSSFAGVRMGDVDCSWTGDRLRIPPRRTCGNAVLDLVTCYAAPGDIFSMPVAAYGCEGVAGLELHLEYPSQYLRCLGIESEVMNEPTVNFAGGKIHFVWEDIFNVLSLADGEQAAFVIFEVLGAAPDSLIIAFASAYMAGYEGTDFTVDTEDGYIVQEYPTNNNEASSVPSAYRLGQNYPNPFNAQTTIEFDLPEPSYVTLEIYDLLGRRIAILADQSRSAGYHKLIWDAADQSSGVYLMKIQAGQFTAAQKVLLLK